MLSRREGTRHKEELRVRAGVIGAKTVVKWEKNYCHKHTHTHKHTLNLVGSKNPIMSLVKNEVTSIWN